MLPYNFKVAEKRKERKEKPQKDLTRSIRQSKRYKEHVKRTGRDYLK